MAAGATLTGFSTADLLELVGHDHVALADLSRALKAAGLAAVAETPIDRLGDAEHASEVIRAVRHGGLGLWRLTVDHAGLDDRLDLIEQAATLAGEVGGLFAFAPLSRLDPSDTPSTGYDDVKTIAIARLVCRSIPSIQVDWALYGPKLAQVAIAYGADDLDSVSPCEDPAEPARDAHLEAPRSSGTSAPRPPSPPNATRDSRSSRDPNRPPRRRQLPERQAARRRHRSCEPEPRNPEPRPSTALGPGNPGTTTVLTLRFDIPSVCAQLLADGAIDLGMVPSITYVDRPGDRIVPGVCIGSDGPVASVALFSRPPMRQVRTDRPRHQFADVGGAHADFCARAWHISPNFRPARA